MHDMDYEEYINQIKAIPILDVCHMLGIQVETRGGKHWCKLRHEKTASVQLHSSEDIRFPNSFHDFGTHQHGDVIQLVSTVQGIERKEAIKVLSHSFGIKPPASRDHSNPNHLTSWEYARIGLHGDRATKNFTFHPDSQSMERILELSEKYAMPMNELRKSHPKIYARLLRDKAIPFVNEMRNEYYFQVIYRYHVFKELKAAHLFYEANTVSWFQSHHIKELSAAEKILHRACQGTDIKFRTPGIYDPIKDLQKIQRGELKPTITPEDYRSIKDAAKQNGTAVKFTAVDFSAYLTISASLDQLTHYAFFRKDKVLVGYLEQDHAAVKSLLEQLRSAPKPGLDQQINTAQHRQTPAIPIPGQHTQYTVVRGEER